MTRLVALNQAVLQLRQAGVADAESSARFLLADVAGCEPSQLLVEGQVELTSEQVDKFNSFIERRAGHEPVAYILGYHYFCGLKLLVSPDVLIPRPETELLVEKIIERLRLIPQPKILDVGTGSGAIALAIKKALPDSEVTASDVSPAALTIAQRNAAQFKLAVNFRPSDLLDSVNDAFDCIVANLPYVPTERHRELETEIVDHEPKLALFADDDGLSLIKKLLIQISQRPAPKLIVLEIDETHKATLEPFIEQLWPKAKIEFEQDLTGFDRYCFITSAHPA